MELVQKQFGLQQHPCEEYYESPHVTESGFHNLANLCFWNPESWALVKESGIPLMIGIWNPSSTDKESGIQCLESRIHSTEYRNQDKSSIPFHGVIQKWFFYQVYCQILQNWFSYKCTPSLRHKRTLTLVNNVCEATLISLFWTLDRLKLTEERLIGKLTMASSTGQSQGSKLATNWSHMRVDFWMCA